MNKIALALGMALLCSPIFVTVKSFATNVSLDSCKTILEMHTYSAGISISDLKCEGEGDAAMCELVFEISDQSKISSVIRIASQIDTEYKYEGQRSLELIGDQTGEKPHIVRFKIAPSLVEDTLQGLVLNNLLAPVAAEHVLATNQRFTLSSNSNRNTENAYKKIAEVLKTKASDSRILWIHNSDTNSFAFGKTHLARTTFQQILFDPQSAYKVRESIFITANLGEIGQAGMFGGGRDFKISYFPKEYTQVEAAEKAQNEPTEKDVTAVAKDKSLVIIDELDVSSSLGDLALNLMLDAYMNEGRTIIVFSRVPLDSFLKQKLNNGQDQGSGTVLSSKLRTIVQAVPIVVNSDTRRKNR